MMHALRRLSELNTGKKKENPPLLNLLIKQK